MTRTANALLEPVQPRSSLVWIEAQAFLAQLDRTAARARNAAAIAELEASWKLS